MARTIGKVDFIVDMDGRAMPAQAAALGAAAGKAAAVGFDKAYNPEMDKRMAAIRSRMGKAFTGMSRVIDRFTNSLRRANKETDDFRKKWRAMPHGFRQATFYTALFAALGTQISVLGSVAGSGLTILGTSSLALLASVGVLIAGFKGMTGELDKIAPSARPAAVALKEMGAAFSAIQDNIQGALFANLADDIRDLTNKLLPVLNVGLMGIAETSGEVLARLAQALTAPASLDKLARLLDGFRPIILALGDAFISLGGALANVFLASLPFTLDFANALAKMFADFNAWTGSLEGQNALAEWFKNGQAIMAAILPLLGAVGALFNNLVTPETIALFAGALSSLTNFMPALTDILLVIARFDLIGLIAAALDTMGQVIQPLIPALSEMAGVFREVLLNTMVALVPILTEFAHFLADNPGLIYGLVAALVALKPALLAMGIIKSIVDVFQLLGPVFSFIATKVGPLLAPVLSGIATAFRVLWAAVTGPIGWVIAGVTLLVSALVWFFTQTEIGKEIWAGFVTFLQEAWANIVTFVTEAITNVSAVITDIVAGISAWWNATWTAFFTPIAAVFNAIFGVVSFVVTAIYTVIHAIVSTIVAFWQLAWWGVSTAFTLIWKAMVDFLTPIIETISLVISTALAVIAEIWNTAWGAISSFFTTIWEAIVGFLSPYIEMIVGVISTALSVIGAIWNTGWGAISGFFSTIWEFIVGYVTTYIGIVQSIIATVTKAIGDAWNGFWGGLGNIVRDIWNGIVGFIKNGINGVIDLINGFLGTLNDLGKAISSITGGAVTLKVGKIPRLAAGYMTHGPMFAQIGEAGPEAVVPLDRPLSQVNPDVRALSAFAQGLPIPGGSSSTTYGGAQRHVTLMPGAVQVTTAATDGSIVATQTVDHIVATL